MVTGTFFWHDYETFGVVPGRDRPAQFAGIRTDFALNEVAAPVVHYCQPASDCLPDPDACLLTGILPQTCLERGLPEHAFAAAIESELGLPGTTGVGYNSLRFDDEVTRHLFWRNLIDPYAREWQNECSRWDLMDVVRCSYALRPEGIRWPKHDDGRVAFKLAQLTAANGIAHESAHDALSDVRATLALARLVKTKNPKLFDFCLKLRKKDAVLAEVGPQGARPFLHVSGMYPSERGCLAVVWPLGPHPVNKNELIVWDLASDPSELFALDAQTVRLRMFTKTDDLPENVERLPIKTIHINKSPVVIGQLKTLSAQTALRWELDMELALRHASILEQHGPWPQAFWANVFTRPTPEPARDVDQDLYSGFIGTADRRTLSRLRSLTPDALAKQRVGFEDPRLEELLFRYRARNFFDSLTHAERVRWEQHCSQRLHDGVGGGLKLGEFFARIDELSTAADEHACAVLAALRDYAKQITPPRE